MSLELDAVLRAEVTSFDALDAVGVLTLGSGERLRFGRTACVDFVPAAGLVVFVTVVAAHPLGGRRALRVRMEPISEAAAREREALAAARMHDAELALAREHTSAAQIAQRIADAVEREDANLVLLYELTRDLELITPSRDHLSLLLQGIADAPPMTHFGNPGPLVHFLEKHFYRRGYVEALLDIAARHPRAHFVWMLMRLRNEPDVGAAVHEVLTAYAARGDLPELQAFTRESMAESGGGR
jgi:hypothetical protein